MVCHNCKILVFAICLVLLVLSALMDLSLYLFIVPQDFTTNSMTFPSVSLLPRRISQTDNVCCWFVRSISTANYAFSRLKLVVFQPILWKVWHPIQNILLLFSPCMMRDNLSHLLAALPQVSIAELLKVFQDQILYSPTLLENGISNSKGLWLWIQIYGMLSVIFIGVFGFFAPLLWSWLPLYSHE